MDEAIQHCEEVAEKCEFDTDWGMGNHFIDRSGVADVIECGKEHRQLAKWLKELEQLREQTSWVPVGERLPNKDGTYLVTVKGLSTKHIFVETASYTKDLHKVSEYDFESGKGDGWYNYDSEYGYFEIDSVTAWMSLPHLYKEEGSE